MTVDPARSANPSSQASMCPHCGGSGTLRLGGQRYRTCLPCLGQGQTPSLKAAITMAKLAALRAEALRNATQFDAGELSASQLSGSQLSAAASAAAAR
jgi:DnaJ-class molecular chaperone